MPTLALDRGSTLPFAPMKTYDPISVDLREKRREEKKTFLSLSNRSLLSFHEQLFDFIFFLLLLLFGYMAHITSFGSVFIPKQFIYFSFTLF